MKRIAILLTALYIAACGVSGPKQNIPPSKDAVRSFYVGLAALQVGDDPRAKEELTKATQLSPAEPAAWTNLGILQLRQKDFDASAVSLERARTLADKNTKIYETIALLEKQRGNFEAAQTNLQTAIDLDPNNLKAMYALAKENERLVDDTAAHFLYERILDIKRDNLEVRLESIRLAAKQNDADAVNRISLLLNPSPSWEPEIQKQFEALKAAIGTGDTRSVLTQVSFFRNTLLRNSKFRSDVAEVKYSETTLGEPFTNPLTFKVLPGLPAPADTAIKFEAKPEPKTNARWNKFVYLNGDAPPVTATALENETRIGDATIPYLVYDSDGLAAFDYDYDFKNDIAMAGLDGFRLFRQENQAFVDVTAETKLPADIIKGHYRGVWVFDVESDGDLDLVLGTSDGKPRVLQNNSDGTFSAITPFHGIDGLARFASVDFDEDGDADVIALDANHTLLYFANERGGQFAPSLSSMVFQVADFDVGDVDADGRMEIVLLLEDGRVLAIAGKDDDGGWKSNLLFQDNGLVRSRMSIMLGDVDNNGAPDIVLGGGEKSSVWLCDPQHNYLAPLDTINSRFTSLGDINNDGRLDLTGTSGPRAETFLNRGSINYNWQTVRPRAAKISGDQRVNSFGIGGELELRAGSMVQKRVITEPVVHFGLGEQTAADVLRVVWQNGYVQGEFDLKPNQTIAAEQRLKGSCPHLFAFDGESFKLVKDAPPWSPALGLKINAQDIFGVLETEEWFKIPGAALKPTNENFYELRITGEYWESFYLDHYSLLAVDHPEGTEVFTDERFAIPPAPLEVFTTGPLREFAAARGDRGQDVSEIIRTLDEKYLDDFDRGTFQGVAKDHYVEVDLPADAPIDKRMAIVADGWVHPTDASINVQLGQSAKEKPRSLSLEVRDENGAWKIAKENLGFPAGKMKTVLIELPIGARAVRLRTNMEIFWDKLAWGVYENGEGNRTARLELEASELRYRGFSVIEKADDSSPEKPVYDRMLTTAQRWRDMEGYFTRFGDVRELVTKTDNRFVLMNAGDELVLRFPALPAPAVGYRRDFVLIGNGWIKDGDLNSVFSKTLLPLPTHASNDYSKPPTTLENDPVYRQHKADWLNFHTRYVSPDAFRNALR